MEERVKRAKLSLTLGAVFWGVLGAGWLFRLDGYSGREHIVYINALLMIANAFVMLYLAELLARRIKWIFWPMVAYLVVVIGLTVLDEFGAYDIAAALLHGVILWSLLSCRKAFAAA